jgi:hypothetical protein
MTTDRDTSQNLGFNGLSHAQAERLACLAGTMGEAIQVIGKILRHGYDSRDPRIVPIESGPTNRERLQKELGDIRYWISIMSDFRDVNRDVIAEIILDKVGSKTKCLHHNPGL